MTNLTNFQKLRISARYWLLGMAEHDPEYYKALEALEMGLAHHNGNRNGGEPEFIHQLGIFHHIRTLHKHIKNPALVYTLIFLHDILEDPNQATNAFIAPEDINTHFGNVVLRKLSMMSKKILGQPNPEYSLEAIFGDEDCSVAKGGDRVNNVSTMFGVFKPNRLERYVIETAEKFIPLIKSARRKFPHQEAVYENIKLELVNQLTLINHLMAVEDCVAFEGTT